MNNASYSEVGNVILMDWSMALNGVSDIHEIKMFYDAYVLSAVQFTGC